MSGVMCSLSCNNYLVTYSIIASLNFTSYKSNSSHNHSKFLQLGQWSTICNFLIMKRSLEQISIIKFWALIIIQFISPTKSKMKKERVRCWFYFFPSFCLRLKNLPKERPPWYHIIYIKLISIFKLQVYLKTYIGF